VHLSGNKDQQLSVANVPTDQRTNGQTDRALKVKAPTKGIQYDTVPTCGMKCPKAPQVQRICCSPPGWTRPETLQYAATTFLVPLLLRHILPCSLEKHRVGNGTHASFVVSLNVTFLAGWLAGFREDRGLHVLVRDSLLLAFSPSCLWSLTMLPVRHTCIERTGTNFSLLRVRVRVRVRRLQPTSCT
jgi:hypothetical protein